MSLEIRGRQLSHGIATAALVLFAGACNTDPAITSPDLVADGSSLSTISLSEARTDLATPPATMGVRVEVRIRPGSSPLVATELALAPPTLAPEREEVQANITSLEQADVAGSIGTDLGVTLSFDDETAFTQDDGGVALTRAQFVSAVNAALAAGRHPHVTARRSAPAAPQGPADGRFLADQVRLGGASDSWRLSLNAGRDNLELNNSPPPDAWLRLLGLSIEIRISDGTTKVGRRTETGGQRVEFEGVVKAVDLERRAFMLHSGAVVLINEGTVIGGDGSLKTLAAVAEALRSGSLVLAYGNGTLVTTDPRVILAQGVKFASRPVLAEFHEGVKAVDVAGRKFTLTNGAVLCLDDASVINQDGELKNLADVAAALEAGRAVGAEGKVKPAAEGSGCRGIVVVVRFGIRPPPLIEFRDGVKSVDLEHHSITLLGGPVLCFNDASVIDQAGDLKSLADVAAARAAGKPVAALGVAMLPGDAEGCRAIVVRVKFLLPVVAPPPELEFHEGVHSVDVAGRRITLSSGIVLCIDNESAINAEGEMDTLAEVAAALADHKLVKADGTAIPALDGRGCKGIVRRIRFGFRT